MILIPIATTLLLIAGFFMLIFLVIIVLLIRHIKDITKDMTDEQKEEYYRKLNENISNNKRFDSW